jgi:hypothetical protein
MSGCWVYPWRDERIRGELIAFSVAAKALICLTSDGQRFEMPIGVKDDLIIKPKKEKE